MNSEQQSLQEYADGRDVRLQVDRRQSVVRGVKILGLRSRNGRVYLPAALAAAAALYEGAKVNVNHPKGPPHAPRDYQDRIGTLRGVQLRAGEGLFGDLHLNPGHALAEQLLWDAEHAPGNVGLSHNVQAQVVRRGGELIVESIVKVQGVDLVADPATTRGLYEANGTPCDVGAGAVAEGASLCEALVAERDALAAQVERLQEALRRHERLQAARRLMAEHGLPDFDSPDPAAQAVVGGAFLESLLAAADDASVRELVRQRARLLEAAKNYSNSAVAESSSPAGRPRSRERCAAGAAPAPGDVLDFVRAITG